MTYLRALVVSGLVAASPARAVYAPIPDREQGKDLTVTIRGGVSYDDNLFGAATNEVDSVVWTIAPRAVYNASVTDQTFVSASYGLTLDLFEDRPGDKSLDSHDLSLRLAHAFSKSTTIDINDSFTIARNPESQLPGVGTLNTDQSFRRNQLDGRFVTPLNPKVGVTLKARSVYYDYRNATLGRSLDRIENLFGVAGDYAALPEVKAVAEYRHQDIYYRKQGELKNKRSDYFMAGADYDVAQKIMLSGRVGGERRSRAGEADATSPYVEISGKYDYTKDSFLVGGYAYTLEETSDTSRFSDSKLHRLFANVQHSVTALIVASGSLSYEPAQLQGRSSIGQRDVDEDTVRLGLALSYLPSKNWTVSASYDYDRVFSGEASRDLRRNRIGLSAIYTF